MKLNSWQGACQENTTPNPLEKLTLNNVRAETDLHGKKKKRFDPVFSLTIVILDT